MTTEEPSIHPLIHPFTSIHQFTVYLSSFNDLTFNQFAIYWGFIIHVSIHVLYHPFIHVFIITLHVYRSSTYDLPSTYHPSIIHPCVPVLTGWVSGGGIPAHSRSPRRTPTASAVRSFCSSPSRTLRLSLTEHSASSYSTSPLWFSPYPRRPPLPPSDHRFPKLPVTPAKVGILHRVGGRARRVNLVKRRSGLTLRSSSGLREEVFTGWFPVKSSLTGLSLSNVGSFTATQLKQAKDKTSTLIPFIAHYELLLPASWCAHS